MARLYLYILSLYALIHRYYSYAEMDDVALVIVCALSDKNASAVLNIEKYMILFLLFA